MKKISIIVSAYNEEKYIKRCINSLLSQSLNDIEVIVINDGSTDNTKKIVSMIKDDRLIVINKKNEGQGISRNIGIKESKGEYITFVDADDYVDKYMYEKMYSLAKKYNADSVICNWCLEYQNGTRIKKSIGMDQKLYENDEIVDVIIPNIITAPLNSSESINISGSAAKTIYKNSIIKENDINFISEKKYISEDLLFNISFYQNATKTYILDENLYVYSQLDESYSHTYKSDLLQKSIAMKQKLMHELSHYNNKEINNRIYKSFINNLITICNNEFIFNKKNALNNISLLTKNKEVRYMFSEFDYKNLSFRKRIFCIFLKYRFNFGILLLCFFNDKRKSKGEK